MILYRNTWILARTGSSPEVCLYGTPGEACREETTLPGSNAGNVADHSDTT